MPTNKTKKVLAALALATTLTGTAATFAPSAGAQAACSVDHRLRLGQRGSSDVRCLQIALEAAGVNPGPVDGYFGPVTRAAVVAYQTAKGLTVDGWVGPQTAGSLGIWWAPTSRSASAPAPRAPRTSAPRPAPATNSGVDWDRLAQCESGGNWSINTGNGYYGGLQFLASTWRAYGGTGLPHQHSRETQIAIAERVRADVGMRAWPGCSRKFGWI